MSIQTYTRLEVDFFSEAREQFGQAIAWLNSPNCPKAHSELERQLRDRGMELLRALLQGQLNRLSDRERQQPLSRTPEPGVQVRTRARDIESDFGHVTLGRLGYKRKGRDAEFPLDRELNLLQRSIRIYVATALANLRKSFEGLSNEVRSVLLSEPLSGHVYLFLNRCRTQVKMLMFTRGGTPWCMGVWREEDSDSLRKCRQSTRASSPTASSKSAATCILRSG